MSGQVLMADGQAAVPGAMSPAHMRLPPACANPAAMALLRDDNRAYSDIRRRDTWGLPAAIRCRNLPAPIAKLTTSRRSTRAGICRTLSFSDWSEPLQRSVG